MKSCVVVGTYYSIGQTFVNRHIEHLFGGAKAVITDHMARGGNYSGAICLRDDPGKTGIIGKLGQGITHLRYGTKAVPTGAERVRILEFLRLQAPDFMLAEFGPQGLAIAPLGNELGIPVFCYFRGSDASSRIRHKHVQRAYRMMMPRLAGVFSVSQFLLDNLASVGVAHPNSTVIPSGVDVRRFRPGQKTPGLCVGVGRFVEKKSPLLTIRAFAKIARRFPHARLLLVGDGELYAPARELVAELGLKERVSLPGAWSHDKVCAALSEAQVYVQHSVTARNGNTEGLPTSIQEAMSSGCIVVSTRHAGIPEAVKDGEMGFLSAEHDEDGFTSALETALSIPAEVSSNMAKLARSVAVDRFDNAKLLVQLENSIAQTVKTIRR